METTIYTTSMDQYVTLVSIGNIILFIVLSILGIYLIRSSKKQEGYTRKMNFAGGIFLQIIILLPLSSCVRTFIKHYEVNETALIIHRPTDAIQVPIVEITEVKPLSEGFEIKKSWGNNGMFGYSGEFTNPEIGRFTIYAKNTEKLVLIKTIHQGNIVIAPDDIAIIEELN